MKNANFIKKFNSILNFHNGGVKNALLTLMLISSSKTQLTKCYKDLFLPQCQLPRKTWIKLQELWQELCSTPEERLAITDDAIPFIIGDDTLDRYYEIILKQKSSILNAKAKGANWQVAAIYTEEEGADLCLFQGNILGCKVWVFLHYFVKEEMTCIQLNFKSITEPLMHLLSGKTLYYMDHEEDFDYPNLYKKITTLGLGNNQNFLNNFTHHTRRYDEDCDDFTRGQFSIAILLPGVNGFADFFQPIQFKGKTVAFEDCKYPMRNNIHYFVYFVSKNICDWIIQQLNKEGIPIKIFREKKSK